MSQVESFYAGKSTKCGRKIWSLVGVSSYVYNFEIVGEHDRKGAPVSERATKGIGKSGFVVANFTQSLDHGKRKVNFHNYFVFLDLLVYLKKTASLLSQP